ncbi:MAG: hypothetical protein R3E76_10350 [Planctomycetota bacterium]
MHDLADIPSMVIAASDSINYGRVLRGGIAIVVIVSGLVTWVISKSMRGSAMKKWATARGLSYSKDGITGMLEGHQIEVTLTDNRINAEQMQFRGTCRVKLRGKLPDHLRIVTKSFAANRAQQSVKFPDDPAFEQALTATASDPVEAAAFLADPNLRLAILHFFSVTPGMEVGDNSVTASASGVVAIGGDPSHVIDTPLRRCGQLIQVLQVALAGQPVDIDSIPGLRPGGGLVKGPLKAKNIPTRRKPGSTRPGEL